VPHVLGRIPLRWQLTMLYILSISFVLGLLGVLLWTEVDSILVNSVYIQLRADAGPILKAGQLQAVTVEQGGALRLPMGDVPTRKGPGSRWAGCPGPKCGDAMRNTPWGDIPAPLLPKPPGATASASPDTHVPELADVPLDEFLTTDVVARFVDSTGEVRGQAGASDLLARVPPPSRGMITTGAQGKRELQYTVRLPGGRRRGRVAVLLEPAATQQGSVGVLQLAASLDPVDHFMVMFRFSLLAGLMVALATGTAVGLSVTGRLLKPLHRMAEVSRTVADGDLSRRFMGPTGSREVRTLARSFNHMIDQLETSLRSQQQFTADAAHELRTPLTALGGSVELLLMGADGGDPQRTQKVLQSMDRELQRLTRLVNDLLQLSRMDGGSPLVLTVVDVASVAADVAAELQFVGSHAVVAAAISGPLPVFGDHDRLKQVLLNLGDNALKFSPPGGTVTLSAWRAGDLACLRVADTGPGIAAQELDKIFDRFYRSDPSRARASGGMGLGLSIVQAIVEAHGGKVRVSSEPGVGTSFTVELPCMTTDGGMQAPDVVSRTSLPAVESVGMG